MRFGAASGRPERLSDDGQNLERVREDPHRGSDPLIYGPPYGIATQSDGEPGANRSPVKVLAAVRATDWQDRTVASLFSNPVIITYVDADNVQLAQSTDDRLLPRIGENVRLGRTPYVVERIGYDIPTDTVERVWIVCRPA